MQPGEPQDFRQYLQEELLRRCQRNPRYSIRAYSKALEVDYSTLSKILRGKRRLGRRSIFRFASRLGLDPTLTQKYVEMSSGSTPETASMAQYQQLTLDTFQIIADWYHYAILELMRVTDFNTDPVWIGRRLGLSTPEVQIALERLQRVGLLQITAEGKWVDLSAGQSTTVGHQFSTAAFRNLQRQVLLRAIDALDSVPMDERDQSSMTMAIDSKRLPEAKEMVRKFRRDLAQFLSKSGPCDAVYQLGISLYPLTQVSTKPAAVAAAVEPTNSAQP